MALDDRLAEVLGAWYEARDSGTPRDPADLIADNPDIADELRVHFELMETIGATRPAASTPPTRLGCYEILSELGSGGMGTVYHGRVRQAVAGLEAGAGVALKVIHPNLLSQPGFFKRFLREAQIGQDVRHENVVRTYDCDATESDGKAAHYLVMEYVEGQTLRDLLRELERVPEELCRHIGLEVAKGLAAIHEAGVVHRDIKPENVLITEEHVVKVMDLGVARLQEEALRLSQAGAFVGSLEYAAPEQFRSAGEEADGRADLHALGVVLYELSTGQHPYRDEDASRVLRNILDEEPRKPGDVNPQLSPFFEEVIRTLMAKDREERFASATDLAAALAEGEKHAWWRDRAKALRLETKQPLRRIRIPRETALYGRDDDLAKLQSLYEQAKQGDGQVVLIEGEAGIGKTRLVDEFVGRLREQGEEVNFLFGSYPPGGAATAAGAFSEAYREQFGAETLEETLVDYLTPTPILIPAFAAILKGETTPTGAEPLAKDSLQTVFVHATQGLAAERTAIVLIDDLHFAPEDGRALFTSLAMATPGHRILLLGTMRPGVSEDWIANVERLDHASRNVLSRLGPKDLAKLLGDAFRSKRLAEELAYQIGVKSDGNPFFAFEIIRGLREGQFISQLPDGTWVTTKIIEDIQVPSSVLDLVNARVADLTEEERDLLDVASCCGFSFDPALVAEAAGMPLIPALKRFGHIERRHRLVRTAGSHCVFDHHQVQESVYGSLMPKLREAYHLALGDALESQSGASGKEAEEVEGAVCVDLCNHFLMGAAAKKALRYLDPALKHLVESFLHEQVLDLADRALLAPDLLRGKERVDLLLQRNRALTVMGRHDAQAAGLEEARAIAEASHETSSMARVRAMIGSLHQVLGQYADARKELEQAVELAREAGDPKTESAATGALGIVSLFEGRIEEAQGHFERDLALSLESNDRKGQMMATGNLGSVQMEIGQHESAERHFKDARALARELGHLRGEAQSSGNLGALYERLGRNAEAREQAERYLTLSRQIGFREGEAIATLNLGAVDSKAERYADAREHTQDALALSRALGALRLEHGCMFNLIGVFLLFGRHAEARRLAERLRGSARESGMPGDEALALELLSQTALEEGDLEDAVRLGEEALALNREIQRARGILASLVLLGEVRWRRGDLQGAREALEEATDADPDGQASSRVATAHALLACLPGSAVDAAIHAASESGCEESMERCYFLWRATQDPAHLEDAKRLLDHRVEHAPEEYRETTVSNVTLHREIMEAWVAHGTG